MYNPKCEHCDGPLYVISFSVMTVIPLTEDGFNTADTEHMETDDEMVRCGDCMRVYPLTEAMV